jgi:hypothetical protein
LNERFWVPDERRAGRGSSRGVAAEGLRGERRGVGEDERGFRFAGAASSWDPDCALSLPARKRSSMGGTGGCRSRGDCGSRPMAAIRRARHRVLRCLKYNGGGCWSERERRLCGERVAGAVCELRMPPCERWGTSAGPRGARATETRALSLRPSLFDRSLV